MHCTEFKLTNLPVSCNYIPLQLVKSTKHMPHKSDILPEKNHTKFAIRCVCKTPGINHGELRRK